MASLNLEERWQTKTSSVLERSKLMFNNTLISDIKFAFPNADSNSMISAHKYVLAISSPVFFTMFYGDLAETSDTINITDCDPDIFLRFLRFIYCEEANFEDMMCAIDVWHLADKYDVPSLAKECLEYLDGNMDPVDAFDLLTYARQFNNEFLEKTCWEVIDYNAEAIVVDESFLDVEHEFLLCFVKRRSARIKELALFQALDRWATKKCEEASTTADGEHKRRFLGEEMIRHFRFSSMSPQEFSDEVEPLGVLQANEILDVFKQFTSVSIPGRFKFSTSPRRKPSETMPQSCDLGNISSLATLVSRKTGVLTFAVTKDVLLSGVKIVTDKGREYCRVSLAIAHGDKQVRRIKDHNFICNYHSIGSYGEIDVVFNRPFALAKNTCYTIKTNSDTTNNLDSGFVRQTSGFSHSGLSISRPIIDPTGILFGSTLTPSLYTNTSNNVNPIISYSYFGTLCDKNCPEHSAVGGEITKLVFVHDNEPTHVPRWHCGALPLDYYN